MVLPKLDTCGQAVMVWVDEGNLPAALVPPFLRHKGIAIFSVEIYTVYFFFKVHELRRSFPTTILALGEGRKRKESA